jgi:hypothetical protein
MQLDEKQTALLKALIDQIIPPRDYPGVYEAKILPRVEKYLAEASEEEAVNFGLLLTQLDQESYAVFGGSFTELHPGTRDELLDRLETDNVRLPWPTPPAEFVQTLVDLTADALGMTAGGE